MKSRPHVVRLSLDDQAPEARLEYMPPDLAQEIARQLLALAIQPYHRTATLEVSVADIKDEGRGRWEWSRCHGFTWIEQPQRHFTPC